jgi:thiamine-phosphate pyrophosphorylase
VNAQNLRGLYAVTDARLSPGEQALGAAVAAAIRGGARLIQYRDKGADHARREVEALALLGICRTAGVPLIVNDDVALAAKIGADGVHLGKADSNLIEARARLGRAAIIGISCYASFERALAARRQGASYIAFGSVFPSPTKPNAVHAPLALFTQARAQLDMPIAAIGGLTPDNANEAIAAGASMIAAISGVFGTFDPETAARRYARLFEALSC